ncbi:toxin of the YeeV-YeeU toxin-antitoxin system, partial [Escherichia coli]|nr:toxin of the YeeV-YeeU toxin-antitoxin system [Escherichia coli]
MVTCISPFIRHRQHPEPPHNPGQHFFITTCYRVLKMKTFPDT